MKGRKRVAIREDERYYLRLAESGRFVSSSSQQKGRRRFAVQEVHGKPCSHVTHAPAHRDGSWAEVSSDLTRESSEKTA